MSPGGSDEPAPTGAQGTVAVSRTRRGDGIENREDGRQARGNVTAERAVEVLLLFDDDHPTWSATTIARRLGASRSTTYRYLQNLRSAGLIEESDAGFRLGPRVLYLAQVARKGMGMSEAAIPTMRKLATATEETIILTRLIGDRVICLEREESRHRLRLSYERGQVLPVHAGASALILLAWLSTSALDEILGGGELEAFTASTTTDERVLRARLGEIRRRGYAVTFGERDPGVVGVAAPIWGQRGGVAAGVSVVMPQHRLSPGDVEKLVEMLLSGADEISRQLALMEVSA